MFFETLVRSLKEDVLNLFGWRALVEMANVPRRVYRLSLSANDIKFNLLQGRKLPHDARIKVFRKDPVTGPNFSIRLSRNPERIEVMSGEVFVTAKDLRLIVAHIKRYREAYIKMWVTPGMDIDDLAMEIDRITKEEES